MKTSLTIQEFNNPIWGCGMKVEILSGVFKGKVFDVVSPDFDQALIGCDVYGDDEASGMWLSYEAALSAGITECLKLLERK